MANGPKPIPMMSDQPSHGAVFGLIDAVARKLRRIQALTMKESGQTPPRYQVLKTLDDSGTMPLKDLAQACRCTPATLTAIVDTLERQGLASREPNPADRRSLLAKLTDEGRALVQNTVNVDRVFDSCCSGLSPDEMVRLTELLTKLDASLDCDGETKEEI